MSVPWPVLLKDTAVVSLGVVIGQLDQSVMLLILKTIRGAFDFVNPVIPIQSFVCIPIRARDDDRQPPHGSKPVVSLGKGRLGVGEWVCGIEPPQFLNLDGRVLMATKGQ